MPHLTRRVLLLASAAAALPLSASAAEPAEAEREAVLRLARDFAAPRYRILAEATRAQAEAWAVFREAPKAEAAPGLQAAFRAAADAWSGIEMVRVGPIAESLRYERMAHWPERNNAVAKALASLLAGADEITAERLRRASVAGQGLTALERLLFDEGDPAKAARDLAATPRRAALAAAIAANLATMAAETLDGWAGQVVRWEQAEPDDIREAATRLATDHLAAVEAVADAKIGTVLGKAPDTARPRLAEGWRSGRPLAAIRLNLDAARDFSRIVFRGDEETGRGVLIALDTARSIADDIAAARLPFGDMAQDRKRRSSLVLLRDAALSAREVSAPALAGTLAVTIGFNSADGD